ncbi:helix-turn-helix transcriptional regulator [Erysipelothrix sp. HDW6C]|uniref:helix-turn-helix domain-containing protein n=1 Tax=Erysipelothrix sp. HDW6C TaxID=2714930 RepID=UPI00140A8736|nr:helix-turn-helix transcriptional regulator [Erysipelothrix sp. HDW6C]QIK68768.1 helix-turn-helix transcriptional regulator [Erysipelothrix sp. HDW6C]
MTYSLYEARVMKKKSQAEVAKALGVTLPTWRNYETGKTKQKLPADKFIIFCEFVEVDPTKIDFHRT